MREDEIAKKVSLDREGMTPTDCAGLGQCSECEEVRSYRAEEPKREWPVRKGRHSRAGVLGAQERKSLEREGSPGSRAAGGRVR